MKRRRLFLGGMLLIGCCAVGRWVAAQDAEPAEAEQRELRVYRVADLLVPTPDYPYPGGSLPTAGMDYTPPGMGGMGMGMGAMGMGGAAAAYGPGAMARPGAGGMSPGGAQLFGNIGELIQAMTTMIAPGSWSDTGAKCMPLGGLLLIEQTPAAHEQIGELLRAVRSEGGAAQSVVIEAIWLLLDSEQLQKLVPAAKTAAHPAARITVDPPALEQMVRQVPSYRGRITCFSGQTVHVVSGNRRSVVMGAIPVIGGTGAAYQPLLAIANIGALLQVTPSLLPGTDTAVIDLQSTVTGWQQPDQPILFGSSSRPMIKETGEQGVSVQVPGGAGFTTVDRVIMPAQQLATTLRVPLGRPVLVGGLTLNPAESAEGEGSQQERKQLYLIVRTSTCEEDPSRVPEKPAATSR